MAIVISAMADAGVMAGGNAWQATLVGCPVQHWAELHRAVALGAGQRCDPIAVAIHQPIDDFSLERCPGVNNVMRDVQLFADASCVHKSFGAAGPFATHQPKGEPFHLPAGFHQKSSG
jgi:hypothetical protein